VGLLHQEVRQAVRERVHLAGRGDPADPGAAEHDQPDLPAQQPATSLSFTVSGGNINVSVSTAAPNANVSVVVVEVSGVPAPAGGSTGIVSAGIYKLVSRLSGTALDNGNTGTDGATVIQWTDNGGPPQKWHCSGSAGGPAERTARSTSSQQRHETRRGRGDGEESAH
jgi:hypothetical protein